MNRVAFYVDGFNFYYGLAASGKKDPLWKRFYWIDVVKLFGSFLSDGQELSKVIYFTASPLDAIIFFNRLNLSEFSDDDFYLWRNYLWQNLIHKIL